MQLMLQWRKKSDIFIFTSFIIIMKVVLRVYFQDRPPFLKEHTILAKKLPCMLIKLVNMDHQATVLADSNK